MVLSDRVYINVGGQRFLTRWTTLQQPNCSRLSHLSTTDPTYDPDNNEFYFDRSSSLFECIIDMHRTGTLHLPHGVCVPKMLDEMRFWDVPVENVACCCWTRIREHKSNAARIQELRTINDNETTAELDTNPNKDQPNQKSPAGRKRQFKVEVSCFRKAANSIFMVMDRPRSSHFAMAYSILYLIMTGLSIYVLCTEAVPDFWKEGSQNSTKEVEDMNDKSTSENISSHPHPLNELGFYLEIVTNSFFTFEWILRMIVFPDIKVLLRKSMFWIHFISISSSWIALYSQVYGVDDIILSPAYLRLFFVLRCLRTFHVLRIFHIIRGWDVLVLALRDSMWEITILAVLFVTGMIIFSSLMFYAEYSNPGSFPGIPIGLWWAIVTMTTVGYGDFYPTTSYGYVVGAVCAITGMFATSLPIPIISENFSKMRHGQRLLDDYRHDSRMTIDPLDKRKGVFVCPVCYTRSFLDPRIGMISGEQST